MLTGMHALRQQLCCLTMKTRDCARLAKLATMDFGRLYILPGRCYGNQQVQKQMPRLGIESCRYTNLPGKHIHVWADQQ